VLTLCDGVRGMPTQLGWQHRPRPYRDPVPPFCRRNGERLLLERTCPCAKPLRTKVRSVWLSVSECVCLHECVRVHVCACALCLCIFECVSGHVCVSVYVYVCLRICVCVCVRLGVGLRVVGGGGLLTAFSSASVCHCSASCLVRGWLVGASVLGDQLPVFACRVPDCGGSLQVRGRRCGCVVPQP
jgi:hypothetical protein